MDQFEVKIWKRVDGQWKWKLREAGAIMGSPLASGVTDTRREAKERAQETINEIVAERAAKWVLV